MRCDDWSWRQVRAELLRHDLTLADLSRQCGLSVDLLRKVRALPLERPQAAIAAALGRAPSAIWPSRYLPDGTPIKRRDWLKSREAA